MYLETVVLDNESSLQDVMNVCLQFRVHFPVLADHARRDPDKYQPVTRTKHYIGRLASYLKTARALIDGAFELPCLRQQDVSVLQTKWKLSILTSLAHRSLQQHATKQV
jgi:hypothetical protein